MKGLSKRYRMWRAQRQLLEDERLDMIFHEAFAAGVRRGLHGRHPRDRGSRTGDIMKRALLVLLALGLLAGCSSKAKPTVPAVTVTQTQPAATIAASTSAAPSVAACATLVGQPVSLAIKSATANSITLGCITGTTPASDQTSAGSQACSPAAGQTSTLYYWGSRDATALDQNIYAGVTGGTVIVVPNQTAKYFWTIGGGLASVSLATHCLLQVN